jgi:hypothetical protein
MLEMWVYCNDRDCNGDKKQRARHVVSDMLGRGGLGKAMAAMAAMAAMPASLSIALPKPTQETIYATKTEKFFTIHICAVLEVNISESNRS